MRYAAAAIAIRTMPSGENIIAIDALPTDKIAVPSMRNAAPALPSTAVILKFRIMFSMASPAAFALSAIAIAAFIMAIRAACANTTIRANATCAPLTPIITPVRMAFPTFAHVIARSLV